ncbi:hypothetical protein [Poseidonibacter lekithochrous]|uniref:hypothetical protein n=1 Tax=Poseidonibacter lekithochrous TaxID=1904463 RepID=UPI0008FCD42C|nr:hypothetical protein [Poseidonibacter lekithochrous]QKJ22691.1 hypothetical protein ALEK_1420 [Poseidonibacter lekithochrous]
MNFVKNTQEELKKLNIKNDEQYTIQYLNRDYFNGDENIEKTLAKAIIDEKNEISFLVQDDYGMDKFIKDAKVIL